MSALKQQADRRRPQVHHRDRHRSHRPPGGEESEHWQWHQPLEEAVRETVKRVDRRLRHGGDLAPTNPNKIVAARNGPPAVIGLGNNEYFVASRRARDPLSHARPVLPGRWRPGRHHARRRPALTDFDGHPITRQVQHITWDPIMAEKGGFKHFMLKEIYEQPRAVRDTTLGRVSLDTGKVFLDEMDITEDDSATLKQGLHHRLRHQLARWPGGQVHDRAPGASCRSKWTTPANFAIAIR